MNRRLKANETQLADEVRAKTINYMCTNYSEFSFMDEFVNADMPAYILYASLQDRIYRMSVESSMPGEAEIIATSKSLETTINIFNEQGRLLRSYGRYSNSAPINLRFYPLGEDVGHYEPLIKK